MPHTHPALGRQKIFPIPREGLTAKLLDEEVRFRRLREDSDGCPVPFQASVHSFVDGVLQREILSTD